MDAAAMLTAILEQYRLSPRGIHGPAHWARVQENGLRVGATVGADERVVRLFALFHDACRHNDSRDPDHGRRGAALARQWRGIHFDLENDAFDLLCTACERHTDGLVQGDPTVLACWDADRLDLARAGIICDPKYLGNAAARDPELIAWAQERSLAGHRPALLGTDWGFDPDWPG